MEHRSGSEKGSCCTHPPLLGGSLLRAKRETTTGATNADTGFEWNSDNHQGKLSERQLHSRMHGWTHLVVDPRREPGLPNGPTNISS